MRAAEASEIDLLARLWYEGWHESHAHLVPAELVRLRTVESFKERLDAALPSIRVAGPRGLPVGFCIVRGAELYQLFVSPASRGTGVAAALMVDAEARLSESGAATAWLACAIGNDRAARFYEKSGWHRTGRVVEQVETSRGPFPLEVWRFEKPLKPSARSAETKDAR